MKNLILLLFCTLFFTCIVSAQELSSLRKGDEITLPQKTYKPVLDPLPAGTYSVGTGGYFTTITSAFDKLSTDGIAGPVTLELIDLLYTVPTDSFGFKLIGPISGAGINSRVTIKPAAGKEVIIQGNGECVLYFLNTSYVTINGVGTAGTTTLTVHASQNSQYAHNDPIDFINNSDHNIVQNIILISEDYERVSIGLGFYALNNAITAPDSNLIQNNFIKKAGVGIYVSARPGIKGIYNIITGNKIGSEMDSMITWGIQVERNQNTIIENNIINNIRQRFNLSVITHGINLYLSSGSTIRNNVVYNIDSHYLRGSTGILLSGEGAEYGMDNLVCNNMLYDIKSTSAQYDSRVAGIQVWNQIDPKIYYNSVYLSGTGTNHDGSAALYVDYAATVSNLDVKNNLFVNTRDETPYCASVIYNYTASNFSSDYNDMYYDTSQYNCLVRIGSTDYHTLGEWQAQGKDLHSVTEMPHFITPYLHIDKSIQTYLEKHGTPVAAITADFDGDLRNINYPDIGADEFDGVPAGPFITGKYSIGSAGNFTSIQSAFDKLKTDGVIGEITLELTDLLYQAPADSFGFKLIGPVAGAGENSRIIIKPAPGKNVTINGNGMAVFSFTNTSYVTIDGVSLTGAPTLTIHAGYNSQYGWNDCIDFYNNSDYNIVQKITFINDDYYRYGIGPAFWTRLGDTGTPDYNLIQNNFIKKAGWGIYVSSSNSTEKAAGNIIRGNIIGSETDSLITWGIQTEHCLNTVIENNHIQNLRQHIPDMDIAHGINSYWGTGTIIRNNVIHNIRDDHSYYGSAGILLSGTQVNTGSGNTIYNNMIYDIHGSMAPVGNAAAGIQMWRQANTLIYYNTIYLSGKGACQSGSAALYISQYCSNIDVRNNVLINTRDESPRVASTIRGFSGYSNLICDHNVLYYEPNALNCLVWYGDYFYTLADWQATGHDIHSAAEMPHFTAPYLHIDETISTFIEKHAFPITGIDKDFDGDPRNAMAPDIGADEFDGITGIEDEAGLPAEFMLAQNYPNPFNPKTVIRYSLPQISNVIIKVFDILGNEIEILINEEKPAGSYKLTWSAANLPSGVYFYQLKAGEFTSTKKMTFIK